MALHDDSLEDDLRRVDDLLAKRRGGDGNEQWLYERNPEQVYQLLKRFADHVRETHAAVRQLAVLEESLTRLNGLSEQATNQIEQATDAKVAYAAATHHPHRHRWMSNTCAGCHRVIQAGEHFTLIRIGPGDHPEERAKAAAKQPYVAVVMPTHWACATGHEDS